MTIFFRAIISMMAALLCFGVALVVFLSGNLQTEDSRFGFLCCVLGFFAVLFLLKALEDAFKLPDLTKQPQPETTPTEKE